MLSRIAKETFHDTFTGTCTDEDMQQFLEVHFSEEALRKEVSCPDDFCFFAEVGTEPAGYIRFMEDYTSFPEVKKWKALELKRIYVRKGFQGKGIAHLLMDYYLQYANLNQYELAWLGVWEHNTRAQKFYAKYGFTYSGFRHDFPIGSTPQTDEWLWKFLPPS